MATIIENTSNQPANTEADTKGPATTVSQTVPVEQTEDEHLEFEELTLGSGQKYRIGRPLGSADSKRQAEEGTESSEDSHGPAFNKTVNWPANSAGDTDKAFSSRTGIWKYNISVGGVIYKYRISFYTDQTYNFTFFDEEGDYYNNNVFRDGWHTIDYNSTLPNIVRVRGE